MVWKTMSEVASELQVSKEVIKYHKKRMPETFYMMEKGKIVLFPEGIDYIKAHLKKEQYNEPFETYVRTKLHDLEKLWGTTNDLVLTKWVTDSTKKEGPQEEDTLKAFVQQPESVLNSDFILWYQTVKNLSDEEPWDWEKVSILDVLSFLQKKYKQ